MAADSRLVVIVTEGVAPALLRRFLRESLLPGFARLFEQGAWGALESHVVPYEPPALMTAFTGAPSAQHGWYSYWSVHEPDHKPRVLTSADLRLPQFWNLPQYANKLFSVVNVLGTHPPMPLRGTLISYPMGQTLRACYPPDLLLNLMKSGFPYTHDVSVWHRGQDRHDFVHRVLEADCRRVNLAWHAYASAADVVVVNLTSIDRMCHHYWQELEDGSRVKWHDTAIVAAYTCADTLIQWLLDAMDDRTTLLVFSEIGFGPLRQYISVNKFLAQTGYLTFTEGERAVDWGRTLAAEAVQGTNGINVNVSGRYSDGRVDSRSYTSVRLDVIAALKEIINPYTGFRLFANVLTREEVFEGPMLEAAPDIILFPADERYLPLGDPVWALHVNRPLQSGWHRRDCYWAVAGPCVQTGEREGVGSLVQVLPTINAALGIDSPSQIQPLFCAQPVRNAVAAH